MCNINQQQYNFNFHFILKKKRNKVEVLPGTESVYLEVYVQWPKKMEIQSLQINTNRTTLKTTTPTKHWWGGKRFFFQILQQNKRCESTDVQYVPWVHQCCSPGHRSSLSLGNEATERYRAAAAAAAERATCFLNTHFSSLSASPHYSFFYTAQEPDSWNEETFRLISNHHSH